MKNVEEFRTELKASRDAACLILESSTALEQAWLVTPAAGEGEAGWSPHDVAQHMVYGDWFMVNGNVDMLIELSDDGSIVAIERAATEAAAAWARLKREQKGGLELPGPRETAAALQIIGAELDKVLDNFTDADLAKTGMRPKGPTSIGERLQSAIDHNWEHVHQLQGFEA